MTNCEKRTDDFKCENERTAEIELSIRKKFHKKIFSRFAKALNEYQMLQEGDRVAVCISGGKDSMLLAKCFQELQRQRQLAAPVCDSRSLYQAALDLYRRENKKWQVRLLGVRAGRLTPASGAQLSLFDGLS